MKPSAIASKIIPREIKIMENDLDIKFKHGTTLHQLGSLVKFYKPLISQRVIGRSKVYIPIGIYFSLPRTRISEFGDLLLVGDPER